MSRVPFSQRSLQRLAAAYDGQLAAIVARYDEGYDLVDDAVRAKGVGDMGRVRNIEWISPAGLYYGEGGKEGSRLLHVLGHTGDTLKKGIHGVFHGGRQIFLETVDEVWMHVREQSRSLVSISTSGSRTTCVVDMGREIGYVGVSRAQALAIDQKEGVNFVTIVV